VPVKYWEIIADNLSKAGWNCGCISSTDHDGRQFWVAAAEREDAGRFIVYADEKLTAFLELERAICIGLLTKQL
jgi:hypothetical protein